MRQKVINAVHEYIPKLTLLCLLFIVIRFYEMIHDAIAHGFAKNFFVALFIGLMNDIFYVAFLGIPLLIIYMLFYLLSRKASNVAFVILSLIICVIQVGLIQYTSTTLVLLGGDFWQYSRADMMQTINASGQMMKFMIIFIIAIIAIIAAFIFLPKRLRVSAGYNWLIVIVLIAIFILNPLPSISKWHVPETEYGHILSTNKSYYFFTSSISHFFTDPSDVDIYADSYIGDYETASDTTIVKYQYVNESEYPFLRTDTAPDVFSPYFKPFTDKPNIVIVLFEGLGRAFTNQGAYLGNFTPFLDSLSEQSLYWENFLSEGGRTFAALPSVLGSLPFGKNGFNEFGENMPKHISLISVLKHNGYTTSFSYGGDAHFDLMDLFMKKNGNDNIYDIKTFPQSYIQLPKNDQGFSWGYGDKELYRWYFNNTATAKQPYCNILLTVATHNPFLVNEQEYYLDKFEKRMVQLGLGEKQKNELRHYKLQLASVLFADDAIKNFINAYKSRPEYSNTIFLITGDHRMPEIPMRSKIDRYHVPLIVYSPLLARTAKFHSISTHFDITPSLLIFLKQRSSIQMPKYRAWLGTGIDTTRGFRNTRAYPIMQTKNDLVDFIMGDYMISNGQLFRIKSDMDLEPVSDDDIKNSLIGNFDKFKSKNQQIIDGKKIIPDSIYSLWGGGK